jgi:hypothetical protein
MHPVRTVKYAVTPRPVKKLSRAVYTMTNPLGAAENKLINAMFDGGRSRSRGSRRSSPQPAWRPYSPTAAVSAPIPGTRPITPVPVQAPVEDQLAALMAVQRVRFAPARPLAVPPPPAVDLAAFQQAEWARRKNEAHFWQPAKRRRLREEAENAARASAEHERARLSAIQQDYRMRADAWWQALCRGDPQVLGTALATAFADNPAPVRICEAAGDRAVLLLLLPSSTVLPSRKPHVTPTGRRSSKDWTKTEYQQTYAELLGAHLLATIRESWAVGPSLTDLRIVGLCGADPGRQILFDLDVRRRDGQWDDDTWGTRLLSDQLHRIGRTREVSPLPAEKLRDDAASITWTAPDGGTPCRMTGAIATAAPGRFRTTLAVRQPVRAIVDLRIRGTRESA